MEKADGGGLLWPINVTMGDQEKGGEHFKGEERGFPCQESVFWKRIELIGNGRGDIKNQNDWMVLVQTFQNSKDKGKW